MYDAAREMRDHGLVMIGLTSQHALPIGIDID